jgi:hypothetical protein
MERSSVVTAQATEITLEEFEATYCTRSKISREEYNQFFVSLPCCCNALSCKGWVAISNNPDDIEMHMRQCRTPKKGRVP